MKKKTTIEDIARNLGISKSCVSLALADRYGVSEETRARVLLAAHEMGFDFSKIKKNNLRVPLPQFFDI